MLIRGRILLWEDCVSIGTGDWGVLGCGCGAGDADREAGVVGCVDA